MSQVEMNKEAIAKNRKRIFAIDAEVMLNKALVYQSRAMIEENRLMILSNYSAAFMGNRQLANHNTEEIFENRRAILAAADTQDDIQSNYVKIQMNKASLDYLEHRSKLNSSVLEISQEMAEINARLIEINRKIMDANEGIVEFNSQQIAVNSELLDGALRPSEATTGDNAVIIAANHDSMQGIEQNVKKNRSVMEGLMSTSEENSGKLMANKKEISERRSSIMANRDVIKKNKGRIAGD